MHMGGMPSTPRFTTSSASVSSAPSVAAINREPNIVVVNPSVPTKAAAKQIEKIACYFNALFAQCPLVSQTAIRTGRPTAMAVLKD
jgi:hypothetical protein